MNADDLARQFLTEGRAPDHRRVVDFLRDFDIHDDDLADEVYYATLEQNQKNTK